MKNKCISCGSIIPEGRLVCPNCEASNPKAPVRSLAKLIGEKWFLTATQLAKKAGVPHGVVVSALSGRSVRPWYEAKIRRVLDEL